jgi:hypothetical protein
MGCTPDVAAGPDADHARMESYAVVWSDHAGAVETGRLELCSECFRLVGAYEWRIPYSCISGLHVGRRHSERLRGRPSLVVDLLDGGGVRIGSVGVPGALHELAERLSTLASGATSLPPSSIAV